MPATDSIRSWNRGVIRGIQRPQTKRIPAAVAMDIFSENLYFTKKYYYHCMVFLPILITTQIKMLFMKRMKLLFTLALPVILCQDVHAQTSSRLVAEAHWTNNGAMFKPMDSSSFIYNTTVRGGDLKHTLKYDNSTTWSYLGDTAYVNSWYYTQDFDANNNISTITAQYWSGTSWVLSTRTLYTYNTLNNITTIIHQNWGGTTWVPQTKNVYTYDANNLLLLDQLMHWNTLTSAFDAYSQKTYSYDALTHKLLNETDQDVFSGSPVYTSQYVYTYTSANQLLTTTYSIWNSGWVNSSMTTNAYDVSGNMITSLYQTWDVPSSAWVNVTYNIYSSFTTSHLPQSQINQKWDTAGMGSWVNTMQYTYTYNSYEQLTSSTGQSWNVVGIFEYASGDPKVNYYYSTYSNVNAVKNIVSNNGTANMYPVPASSTVRIDLNWDAAQASTISVYDMAGRMVTPVMNVPVATEYHTSLSVGHLATGTYVVKISGANGNIEKQIVVAK